MSLEVSVDLQENIVIQFEEGNIPHTRILSDGDTRVTSDGSERILSEMTGNDFVDVDADNTIRLTVYFEDMEDVDVTDLLVLSDGHTVVFSDGEEHLLSDAGMDVYVEVDLADDVINVVLE